MKIRQTGLRSEIVIQLSLIMAAAVLFSAVLLLTYLELQLVERRVKSIQSIVGLFSEQLFFSFDSDAFYTQLQTGLKSLHSFSKLESFSIINSKEDLYFSSPAASKTWPDIKKMREGLSTQQPLVEVHYPPGLLVFFSDSKEGTILITQPLTGQGSVKGCMQARFSLADIQKSIFHAQKILLLFLVLYGLILILFGSYLLNKTIVKPIIKLRKLARRITGGQLSKRELPKGPREILLLGAELDEMRSSLLKNRQQTQNHIQELEALNKQLDETRDELVQSAKMSSIGHLAAGMAHEIGNPLGALTGYLDLLKNESLSKSGHQIAVACQNEAGRIDQLVRDLLDYARPDETKDVQIDCLEVIDSTVRNLVQQGALLRKRLKLETPSAAVYVKISANRLQQVLINLLINARDAAPENSLIQLKLEEKDRGELAVISVVNQGAPIPASQVAFFFDPFFTTKAQGKGRGLGLFVCHNIIQDAGGKIEVASDKNKTVFSVALPATKA